MRYRESRDANEADVIRVLTSIPGVRVRKIPNENGTADLLVRRATWGPGVWIMVELKTPKGRVKAHQAAMLDNGEVYLARSVDDVCAVLGIGLRPTVAARGGQ